MTDLNKTDRDIGVSEDIHVRLLSDSRLLCAVRGLVRGYFQSLGFDTDRVDFIVLAIDEACSNAIRHAYGGKNKGYVDLVFKRLPDCLEILIKDDGKPFHISDLKKNSMSKDSGDDLPRGGLGISFMREICDSVEYFPGKRRGNTVRMRILMKPELQPCPPKTD